MFTFLDPREPLELVWSDCPELVAARPRFVAQLTGAEVNGHDTPVRIGAAFVRDARTVCGLRAWDDAAEGVHDGTPWAAFEVEKLVRMMLHQSGLAFELLASARVWSDDFDGRRIIQAAATSQVLAYYEDVTHPLATGRLHEELWRWRSLLSGLLLARHGEVSFRLPTLLERLDEVRFGGLAKGGVPTASIAADAHAELAERWASLPNQVSDYDWLDDRVAHLRLNA